VCEARNYWKEPDNIKASGCIFLPHYIIQWHVSVDTERGVNQYQVQFKTFFNLYLNHSIISNEK
jgi:hypothetical protein